jgi:hypothetical protein
MPGEIFGGLLIVDRRYLAYAVGATGAGLDPPR